MPIISRNQKYFVGLIFLTIVYTISGSTIKVSIQEESGSVGDTILVPIEIDSISRSDSVYSYNFTLSFNNDVIDIYEAVKNNSLSKNALVTVNTNNSNKIVLAMASTSIIFGNKPLLYLKITCDNEGSSDLCWEDFIFNTGSPEAVTNNSRIAVSTVGIINNNYKNPEHYYLKNNYPNPFNSSTQIQYQIAQPGFLNLSIYNMEGNEVLELKNRAVTPGIYSTTWHGQNKTDQKVSSGIYFVRMKINNFMSTRKLIYSK